MMGNGQGYGLNYGTMMNGGWPTFLLGALVVAGLVLLVVLVVRSTSKK